MILKPNPVSSSRFSWNSEHGEFVAEASDLYRASGGITGHTNLFERVYDDACDVGLTIVSAVTGREVVFAVYREVRDPEGEIVCWELEPAEYPNRGLCRARIYND
jgi:hypothetical protein